MKYLRQSDPRFQYLDLKVGSFLLVLFLLLVLMAGLLGWRQDLFESTSYYLSRPERAEGIFPGMDVTLHGIRVGRVDAVYLGVDGQPEVKMRIKDKAGVWLRKDARVWLKGLDPLGTPFLNLQPGTETGEPLAAGSLLPMVREQTLSESAAEMEAQLRPVIAEVQGLISELNRPEGDLRKSLGGLQILSASLAGEMPPALEDLRWSARRTRTFLDDILAEEGDVSRLRKQILGMSSVLDERLPVLIGETEASLAALRRTTAEIEGATKASTPELRELVRSSQETSRKAEALIDDVRRIWLLKVLLPRSKPKGVEPSEP